MDRHQKRAQPRIPLVSVARLTRLGLGTTNEVLVRDISTSGLGIYSTERYTKGDLVLVKFVRGDQGMVIDDSLVGEIAWSTPLMDGVHYAAGIRFDKMEREKPKLYAYIKLLEKESGSGSR